MKLIEIKREYDLNQNTFYGWLKEQQMITKEMTGYVVGPNAIDGMETSTSRRVNEHGEVLITTQVVIENQKIPQLLEQYEASGFPRLYSAKSNKQRANEQFESRITILERQVSILTEQLAVFVEQNSRGHD